MPLETRLKIDADTKDIQRAFRAVMKSQQELSFFQQKLNKKDPFSPKNLRDSQRALGSWSKVFENVNKVASKNNEIMEVAIKRRTDLIRLNERFGRSAARDAQIERMAQIIRVRRGARSLVGVANKTEAGAQSLAAGTEGMLAEAGPEGALAAVGAAVAEKAKNFIVDSMMMGFTNALNIRDLSVLTPAGSIGGINPRTGQRYGMKNLGYSLKSLATGPWQTRDLFELGYDPTDVTQRAVELAQGTGVAASPADRTGLNLIADTLRLNKMGVGQDTINNIGLRLQAGKVGQVTAKELDDALQSTFKKGMTLNFQSTAQMREFFNSVTSLQALGQRTANIDYRTALRTMATINDVDNPMFRGERGFEFAQKLNAGIMHPGGGVAGQLINMQMMGFNGNLMNYFRNKMQGVNAPGFLDKLRKMGQTSGGAMAAASMYLNDPDLAPMIQDFARGKRGSAVLGGVKYGSIREAVQARLGQTDEGEAVARYQELKGLLQAYLSKIVESLITIAGAVISLADANSNYAGPQSVAPLQMPGEKAKQTSHGLIAKGTNYTNKTGQTSVNITPSAPYTQNVFGY